MKEELINDILQRMISSLDNMQMRHLEQVLKQSLLYYDVIDTENNVEKDDTDDIAERFISAKRIEGCSEKTLKYYQNTIDAMVVAVDKDVQRIQTEDLRLYLTQYQEKHGIEEGQLFASPEYNIDEKRENIDKWINKLISEKDDVPKEEPLSINDDKPLYRSSHSSEFQKDYGM